MPRGLGCPVRVVRGRTRRIGSTILPRQWRRSRGWGVMCCRGLGWCPSCAGGVWPIPRLWADCPQLCAVCCPTQHTASATTTTDYTYGPTVNNQPHPLTKTVAGGARPRTTSTTRPATPPSGPDPQPSSLSTGTWRANRSRRPKAVRRRATSTTPTASCSSGVQRATATPCSTWAALRSGSRSREPPYPVRHALLQRQRAEHRLPHGCERQLGEQAELPHGRSPRHVQHRDGRHDVRGHGELEKLLKGKERIPAPAATGGGFRVRIPNGVMIFAAGSNAEKADGPYELRDILHRSPYVKIQQGRP